MREPPLNLDEATILEALATHYDLEVKRLTFLPLGHDSSAWVYEAWADTRLFVKVRLSMANLPSLLVPRYLQNQGVRHVIAPLPTRNRDVWAPAGDFAVIVYPFLEAETAMESGMSPAQWQAYGATFRQIHAAPIPPELAESMLRETYVPYTAEIVRRIDADIQTTTFDDPISAAMAMRWQKRRTQIFAVLERAETLGRQLADARLPLVVCHADAHTGNILVDTHGEVWVVDWDTTTLAPKERDLMFIMGGGIYRGWVSAENERDFMDGYGPSDIDPLALAYYRYAWAVSDIGEYAGAVFFRDDLGEFTRRESIEGFEAQFKPGAIVEIALSSVY